jgi:hypothetical protein
MSNAYTRGVGDRQTLLDGPVAAILLVMPG